MLYSCRIESKSSFVLKSPAFLWRAMTAHVMRSVTCHLTQFEFRILRKRNWVVCDDIIGKKIWKIQFKVRLVCNIFPRGIHNNWCTQKPYNMAAKTKYNDTSWTPCQLTQEGCLSLAKITHDFSAPITEEHAWAVVFECVKCLSSVMEGKPRVFVVTNTQQILLHREGRVHESTFLNDQCFSQGMLF